MTAALKALSPAELMQLEAIVGKLEASAKAEARERDAGERDADDDEVSRRPSRRAYLRGGASEVSEVEAVAAPDEGEPTAEAVLSTTDKSDPGDLT